jgi:asparagine synthase (glutamine-hydrolysing)
MITADNIWLATGSKIYNLPNTKEAIVSAYNKEGIGCVKKFNGQFALAVLDEGEIYLARDRYGIKPLYYAVNNGLWFGSSIKEVLKLADIKAEVDLQALCEYFTFQNVLSDLTLFKDIFIFPAGCYGEWDGKMLSTQRYWDVAFNEEKIDGADAVVNVRGLILEAVERQIEGEKSIGCPLSGGMDSSTIAFAMSRKIKRLYTFTCGFDLSSVSGIELAWDEREYANLVADRIKSEHYDVVLHAGDMEAVLPELIECLEDCRMGQCYPDYYVSRLASKFVKVVLSGAGGDELFGGYPWRYGYGLDLDDYYKYWQRLLPDNNKEWKAFYASGVYAQIKDYSVKDIFDRFFFPRVKGYNPIDRCLYFEMKTFGHGLLVILDKMGQKHGLECRYPYLDNDLVDYVLKLPVSMKVKGNTGKRIFRDAMRGILPIEILRRKKQGFSAPDDSWYRGESMEYVCRVLLDKKARIYDYLNYDYVKTLVYGHINGKSNMRLFIWSLLSFEWWLRRFVQ